MIRSSRNCRIAPVSVLLCMFFSSFGLAVTVRKEEQAEESAGLRQSSPANSPVPAENYLSLVDFQGSVQGSGHGNPRLRIFNTLSDRGLHVQGAKGVVVHLMAPARSFEAVVGIDASYGGCAYSSGKEEFSVATGSKIVLTPTVVRVAAAGVPVNVQLGGAAEFILQNGTDDQKEWCGDAVWANARVTLENGSTLWLDDLPVGPLPGPISTAIPFSFVYGGKPSSELLGGWDFQSSVRELDKDRTEHDLIYRDPASGLIVTLAGIEYHDFPVVEWTLYLENSGARDTPILSDIHAIDTWFQRAEGGEFALHHFLGSQATPTDYEPLLSTLPPKAQKYIAATGGYPTQNELSYFNVDESDQGVIIGLGWPGQWAADFSRDEERGLRIAAGQEQTHFKLLPGEKVRSPLVALLFWHGGWIRGQNLWRKWMFAHNLPQPGGQPLSPKHAATSSPWFAEMGRADEASQKLFIDRYARENIKPDYWWMDAGWYVNKGTWASTGTWEVDRKRFPNGLRAITDYAHGMGMKSIVWFEPERVTRGSWLWEQHPDWLLKSVQDEARDERLLNLGNPDAVKWLIDHMDGLISQEGVDVYRTDFNFEPLAFWRENETPDRQGINEIRYVMGFLQYLDELRRRHPGLLIDTCAGGGRRNDLETVRRAVPMHRSDYPPEPVGQQNMTYGLFFWIPYFGAGTVAHDDYIFRSTWAPQITTAWDVRRNDLDYDWLRRSVGQWMSIADNYFGDYYPLTPYDPSDTAWVAWQFDRPEQGEGMVQVFRRSNSPWTSAQFRLRGLEADARYEITSVDEPGSQILTGRMLLEKGLNVTLPNQSSAAVFSYKRIAGK